MPSRTFFLLLAEHNKLDIYELKRDIMVSMYPHVEQDVRDTIQQDLLLPDDILNDIIESEQADDISTFRNVLEG